MSSKIPKGCRISPTGPWSNVSSETSVGESVDFYHEASNSDMNELFFLP